MCVVLTNTGEAQRESLSMARSLLFCAPTSSLFSAVFGSSLSDPSAFDFDYSVFETHTHKDKDSMDTETDKDTDREMKTTTTTTASTEIKDSVFGRVLTFAESNTQNRDPDRDAVSPGQWGKTARSRTRKSKALSPLASDSHTYAHENEIIARYPTRGSVQFIPNCGVVPLKQLLKLCLTKNHDRESKESKNSGSGSGFSRFLSKHKFENELHYGAQRRGNELCMKRAGVQKLIDVLRDSSEGSDVTLAGWVEQNVLMKM